MGVDTFILYWDFKLSYMFAWNSLWNHANLKLTEISVAASWVQELKACATIPSLQVNI